jgi:glycosyltransferase involved in cell wall biosynthesis|nr:glycosyltransferase [uncultured Alistipes sp.]
MIRLSLVIPTHNRAEQLLVALRSVVRQSADPASWECVVVNNASTDDTEERFAAFAAEHPGINLRMVFEPEPGVSHARNRGLSEARADLLAWIDDDERIGEHFIAAYLDFFDAYSGASVAGGRIVAEYPKGRPRWMSKYVEMPVANPMDFGPAVRPFPLGRVPGGGNMAFRRSLAMRYGGFDVSLGRVGRELIGGEENDFFERLLRGGETIWYVPGAVMWHIIPPEKLTADYFRRLCFNVGRSQRLRAVIHRRTHRTRLLEILKWGATLLLCLTMRPVQSRWLLRMRWQISRGLFGE